MFCTWEEEQEGEEGGGGGGGGEEEEKQAGASTFLATEGVWDPNTGSNSQHVLPFHLNCCKIKDIVSKLIDGVWNSFSKMLGGVIKMKHRKNCETALVVYELKVGR